MPDACWKRTRNAVAVQTNICLPAHVRLYLKAGRPSRNLQSHHRSAALRCRQVVGYQQIAGSVRFHSAVEHVQSGRTSTHMQIRWFQVDLWTGKQTRSARQPAESSPRSETAPRQSNIPVLIDLHQTLSLHRMGVSLASAQRPDPAERCRRFFDLHEASQPEHYCKGHPPPSEGQLPLGGWPQPPTDQKSPGRGPRSGAAVVCMPKSLRLSSDGTERSRRGDA